MQAIRQRSTVRNHEKAFSTVSLLSGPFVMICAGTLYAYSVWAPYLKLSTGFSQTEVNLVGAAGNIGGSMGYFSGRMFDKRGPIPTALISSALIFAGYFLIYLALHGDLMRHVPFFLFVLFNFIVGQGSSYAYSTGVSTNIRNFTSKHRGLVVGLLVSFQGLSSAVITSLYKTYFVHHGGVVPYILTLSILLPALVFVGGMLQSFPKPLSEFDENDFMLDLNDHPEREETSVSGKQLLKRREFWIIACLMFFGTATGMLYINVVGSLYLSLGAAHGAQNLSVLLISLTNCVGRLGAGLITDKLAHCMKKTWYLAIVYVIMCANWAFLATYASLDILPFTSLIAGFCYGSTLSVLPTLTSELFGVCAFAENWGALQPFNSLGALSWSFLAGALYDHESTTGDGSCVGHHCYSYTFMILAGSCALAVILSLRLTALVPPVDVTRKHMLFPTLPRHVHLLRFSFLNPFHHHHTRTHTGGRDSKINSASDDVTPAERARLLQRGVPAP